MDLWTPRSCERICSCSHSRCGGFEVQYTGQFLQGLRGASAFAKMNRRVSLNLVGEWTQYTVPCLCFSFWCATCVHHAFIIVFLFVGVFCVEYLYVLVTPFTAAFFDLCSFGLLHRMLSARHSRTHAHGVCRSLAHRLDTSNISPSGFSLM